MIEDYHITPSVMKVLCKGYNLGYISDLEVAKTLTHKRYRKEKMQNLCEFGFFRCINGTGWQITEKGKLFFLEIQTKEVKEIKNQKVITDKQLKWTDYKKQ